MMIYYCKNYTRFQMIGHLLYLEWETGSIKRTRYIA